MATPEDFDELSRGAILLFTDALAKLPNDEAGLRKTLGIDFADATSARNWRKEVSKVLLDNFRLAAKSARTDYRIYLPEIASDGSNFVEAAGQAAQNPPKELAEWQGKAQEILGEYARNQLRLAALLPKVSNEIRRFSDKELTGFELPDRHFVLTFDDGPTAPGGSTDQTIAALRAQNVSGIFFGLGPALQSRLKQTPAADLANLYKGMTLGIHGITHEPHIGKYDWQASVKQCQALADEISGTQSPRLFRPPFGQRDADAAEILFRDGCRIVLWNIDTQDWNLKLETDHIVARAKLLMALWRRGIILFHDANPHASRALPLLVPEMKRTGIVFDSNLENLSDKSKR